MSRKPRRQFLAPFILTAAVAAPGCKPKPEDTTTHNPPGQAYRTWNVWALEDGGCEFADAAANECPPDASCNPPPPEAVACPEGMTGDSVTIVQWTEGGACSIEGGAETACPEAIPYEEEE